ncbi:MAG: hypothetical protein AB1725_05105 [Armatimonadota bacterium]
MKLSHGLTAIVIAGMTLASSTSQSQVTEAWFENFDYAGGLDVAVDVATDVYGSVYVTGYGTNTSGSLDIVTLKYGRNGGDPIWQKFYDGPANGDDKAVRIHADALGNVFVLGTSAGNGTNRDFVIIKYDTNGDRIWPLQGSFGGYQFHDGAIRTTDTRDEDASDLFVDAAGNVYVIGSVGEPLDLGTWNWKVIVFDQDQDNPGTISLRSGWPQEENGPGNIDDYGYAIGVDSVGRVVGSGQVGFGDFDDPIRKWRTIQWLPSGGTPLWERDFGTESKKLNRPYDLAIDHVDSIYVCGSVDSGEPLDIDQDQAVQKYGSDGSEPWGTEGRVLQNTLGNDEAFRIALECDDEKKVVAAIVTGQYVGNQQGRNYGTWKLSEAGATVWLRQYHNVSEDVAKALAVRGRGNTYVTGWSFGGGTNEDYATVMYSQAGQEVWVRRLLNHSGNDQGRGITVHGAGEALVTGQVDLATRDYGTLKYAVPIGQQESNVTGFTVSIGTLIGGGLSSFQQANDGNVVEIQPDTTQLIQSQVILEGQVPAGASELAFRLVAFIEDQAVGQRIEFFNFSRGVYEVMDIDRVAAQSQSDGLTKMITIATPCDPEPYINDADGKVRVRVSHWNITSLSNVKFDYAVWRYVD